MKDLKNFENDVLAAQEAVFGGDSKAQNTTWTSNNTSGTDTVWYEQESKNAAGDIIDESIPHYSYK